MQGIESYPLRRHLLNQARRRERQYQNFIYEVRIVVTAGGVDTFGVVNIDSDAPFLWKATMGLILNTTGGVQFIANVSDPFTPTILVRIGGPGGKGISQQPIAFETLCGAAPQPVILPAVKFLAAGTDLHVTINKPTGGGFPQTYEIQFIGQKVYGWGPA